MGDSATKGTSRTTRKCRAFRFSDEEVALLQLAAGSEGFVSVSAFVRHTMLNRAREVCDERGLVQRMPDPNTPTIWDGKLEPG